MGTRQGRCQALGLDAGSILDKLNGLQQVISSEQVRQALEATGEPLVLS